MMIHICLDRHLGRIHSHPKKVGLLLGEKVRETGLLRH